MKKLTIHPGVYLIDGKLFGEEKQFGKDFECTYHQNGLCRINSNHSHGKEIFKMVNPNGIHKEYLIGPPVYSEVEHKNAIEIAYSAGFRNREKLITKHIDEPYGVDEFTSSYMKDHPPLTTKKLKHKSI